MVFDQWASKRLAIAQRFDEQISCNRYERTRGKGIAKRLLSSFQNKRRQRDTTVGLQTRIRNSKRGYHSDSLSVENRRMKKNASIPVLCFLSLCTVLVFAAFGQKTLQIYCTKKERVSLFKWLFTSRYGQLSFRPF